MRKALFYIIIIIIFVGGGSTYWFYYNRYGDGMREGILYSFQRKGNVFKTYEGVIIQPGLRPLRQGGLNTNEFYFSVDDPAVADSLLNVTGMQVKVHFNTYRKTLPWRGDNYNTMNKDKGQNMVDAIISVSKANDAYNNF